MSADFVVFMRFTLKRILKSRRMKMLCFLLGLMLGGFVGFAIMCLMQIAHHCDEEKPQK